MIFFFFTFVLLIAAVVFAIYEIIKINKLLSEPKMYGKPTEKCTHRYSCLTNLHEVLAEQEANLPCLFKSSHEYYTARVLSIYSKKEFCKKCGCTYIRCSYCARCSQDVMPKEGCKNWNCRCHVHPKNTLIA